MKALNLNQVDRENMAVVFNVNKFEVHRVYGADSAFMFSASSKSELKADLKLNQITNAKFDSTASKMYMNNYGN